MATERRDLAIDSMGERKKCILKREERTQEYLHE